RMFHIGILTAKRIATTARLGRCRIRAFEVLAQTDCHVDFQLTRGSAQLAFNAYRAGLDRSCRQGLSRLCRVGLCGRHRNLLDFSTARMENLTREMRMLVAKH